MPTNSLRVGGKEPLTVHGAYTPKRTRQNQGQLYLFLTTPKPCGTLFLHRQNPVSGLVSSKVKAHKPRPAVFLCAMHGKRNGWPCRGAARLAGSLTR